MLFLLAAITIAADVVWAAFGHFSIDVLAYARLGLLSLALLAGGLFYQVKRKDQNLAAMLLGASFLCAFSAAASVLNYFLLTVAGPRIDILLSGIDHAMGFDWVRVMTAMSHHPTLNMVFFYVYGTTLPQIAFLLIVLAWSGRPQEVYRFCLAIAVGALIAIFIWAAVPSLGAESMYALSPSVQRHLVLDVTTDYGRELVKLLHNGPGYITPTDIRGLIAFPSYHAVLAMLMVWYARTIGWLRWPVLILNLVVLASAPVQGGHHLIDIFGGCGVTVLAVLAVRAAEAIRLPPGPVLARFAPGSLAGYRPEPVIQSASTRSAASGETL
jgi:PAP2 superfamily